MIDFIKKDSYPEVLVITPLRPTDRISDKTLETIHSNNTKFDWISLKGDGNPYKNVDNALRIYNKHNGLPKYIIKVDNDIMAKSGMLDKMSYTLDNSVDKVAYTYCTFKFTGSIEMTFTVRPFDMKYLMRCNYISSISMMKSLCLKEIGGFITDNKYFRLLDWALWLQFLSFGFIGEPTLDTSFIAYASKNSVSAGSMEGYLNKRSLIEEDFIKKLL